MMLSFYVMGKALIDRLSCTRAGLVFNSAYIINEGSNLKGKNLLSLEQIHSYKSRLHFKRLWLPEF